MFPIRQAGRSLATFLLALLAVSCRQVAAQTLVKDIDLTLPTAAPSANPDRFVTLGTSATVPAPIPR